MSLLLKNMVPCVMLTRSSTEDGEGGDETKWQEGASFEAAIVLDTSIEARRAEKEGVTSVYTVTAQKSVSLPYHAVFKREEDGKTFRVTSDSKQTPAGAGLDMMQVTAEEWMLT